METVQAEATITEPATEDQWVPWKRRIAASIKRIEDKIALWQENVAKRNPSGDSFTSDAVTVNKDWPLTKAKIAQLYSQTPEIRLTPRNDAVKAAVPQFGQLVNDTITDSSVGSAIEEVLADVVNAAGIGAVLVSCEKRTEPREVPEIDPATLPPEMQAQLAEGAFEIPMVTVEHVVDAQYPVQRVSPTDLLVPSDFTGSNYDQARWLGRRGRMMWAEALRAGLVTEEERDDVLGADKRASGGNNSLNTDTEKFRDSEVVNFQEIYYWRHYYHPEETSFKAIQRIVFVDGKDEPPVNEEYTGQRRIDSGKFVGVTKLPIRVLTLTYVSDEGLPPSDSTISRAQVKELEASRDQMVQQRKHSIPIRWFNPNVTSPNTRALLEKGTFQGFVPIANGDRGIGEVARASFPSENFEFNNVIGNEITEQWQVGTNQAGAFAKGERSASEAKIIQQNFQTRVGQERDKVSRFFIGIAECVAGLLVLHGDYGLPEEIAGQVTYSVRVDSTVRLDVQQRIEQLDQFTNKWAQSGYMNPKPIAEEWAELTNLDPGKVIVDPQPKPPEPVKVSVSKAEDLINPVFLAHLMHTGQAPTPEDLAAAMKLLQAAQTAATAMGLSIVPVEPTDPNAPPAEVKSPGISNPEWQEQPRINKRDEDGGA